MNKFSGSYSFNDIEFLLKPIEMRMISMEEKEQLIQSGAAHYSDLLSQEPEPTPEHLEIFENSIKFSAKRLATEVAALAQALAIEYSRKPIVLASLVRAGVPLGVLIHRALRDLGHESYHYGVSIVRDRGIDDHAMQIIESRHEKESIVFVDGWTGKGAIAKQLDKAFAERKGYLEKPRLVVLADPCGMAWLSASNEDWLIPFGILGASISGLVSRSVWSANDLHGCVLCDHLKKFDCSESFIDLIHNIEIDGNITKIKQLTHNEALNKKLRQSTIDVIDKLNKQFLINSINRIKPGIAEATRAVLRRVPERVLVKNNNDPDVRLLVMLARKRGIAVEEIGSKLGQYRAVTIIKKVL